MNRPWTNAGILSVLLGAWLAGCASAPTVVPEAPVLDPATATPEYWLAKPSAATLYDDSYDRLWDICATTAHREFFELDRQDYRDGILTTRPLISKQFWEFWRSDAGDGYYALQDSVQTIRRSIEFDFEREGSGGTVSPKVLIERFAQPNRRVTSPGDYRRIFVPEHSDQPGAKNQGETEVEGYWYSIGRDYEMEAELIQSIKEHLAAQ